MTRPVLELDLSAARALHLAALGLDRRPRRTATKADVLAAIRRMGVLQIDTINVVARSPYLVLFSRLGGYRTEWLEELLAEGELFEYWVHEASFVPVEDYPLWRHRMDDLRWTRWKYSQAWMEKHADDVERVLARMRDGGPVRSADFERPEGERGGWWEWKTEKRALEGLFTAGRVMVARRERFQRVYDLRERVLPGWDAGSAPTRAEAIRTLAERAIRAMGVAPARWVPDWFRTKAETRDAVRTLAGEGVLVAVAVEGWKEPGYVHPDLLPLAEEAAAGRLKPTLTTLLSPFDPLVWHRERASEMFGFDYRIECYTPAPRRRYGYFVLPVLRRGALVGRLDAKAHRKEGRFEVKALHAEPGVRMSGALAADVARALRECAAWHGTPEVEVVRSDPAAFGERVGRALADA